MFSIAICVNCRRQKSTNSLGFERQPVLITAKRPDGQIFSPKKCLAPAGQKKLHPASDSGFMLAC
jgi:hypothetical protein